jgi:hypothetical protein
LQNAFRIILFKGLEIDTFIRQQAERRSSRGLLLQGLQLHVSSRIPFAALPQILDHAGHD